MAIQAPSPVDVQDFQFKLHCRLKVFENESADFFQNSCNLVSTASRFGLVFVGSVNASFKVIQSSVFEKFILKESDATDYNCRVINLSSPPLYLEVNCDSTKLAVVIQREGYPVALIYEISSFLKINISSPFEIRLSSTLNVNILQTGWNPAISNIFAVCKDDGILTIYNLLPHGGIEINELSKEAQATCMCWSPKGKQIAVGSRSGSITQYKPEKSDLKAMKVVNPPPLEGSPAIISLQWISTYQFIGVYRVHSGSDGVSSLITIEAPKTGTAVYINFEDICYSYGSLRPPQFYMVFNSVWNTLMVASSNSMEVGVLGNSNDSWTQWILPDSARAELPLSASKQDTMPVGLAFDTAAIDSVVWGETSLPPAPFLLLLSHHGLLCCFRAINMKAGESICSSPETLSDTSGLSQFNNMKQSQSQPEPAPTDQLTITPNTFPVTTLTDTPLPSSTFQIQPAPPKTEPILSMFNMSSQERFQQTLLPTFSTNPQSPKQTIESKNNLKQQTILQIPKPQLQTAAIPETSTPPPLSKIESHSVETIAQDEMDLIINKTILEEFESLETELMHLIETGSTLKIDIGSEAEAANLVSTTDELFGFLGDITKTNEEQSNEVFSLKEGLIQSWALYEDARARYAYTKSETLKVLLNMQQLDPVSLRYSNDIKKTTYYIQSQLTQASRFLDEQWENFQDACKNLSRLKIPTMEVIYQTMVRQNAIYQKQTYCLKDISNRIRSNRSRVTGPSLLLSLNNIGNLEAELLRLQLEPESWLRAQYNRAADSQKKLTPAKVEKLSNFLLNRKINEVKVKKPQLCNTSLQAKLQLHISKSKNEYDDSFLGARFSPIASHKSAEPLGTNFNRSVNVQGQAKPFINSTPMVSRSLRPISQQQQAFVEKNTFIPVNTTSTGAVLSSPQNESITEQPVVRVSTSNFAFNIPKESVPTTTPTLQFAITLNTKAQPPITTKQSYTAFSSSNASPIGSVVAASMKPMASAFSSQNSSFNLPQTTTATSSSKVAFSPQVTMSIQKPISTSTFSFGSATSNVTVSDTKTSSGFSFKPTIDSVLNSQFSTPPSTTTTSSENMSNSTIFTQSENSLKTSLPANIFVSNYSESLPKASVFVTSTTSIGFRNLPKTSIFGSSTPKTLENITTGSGFGTVTSTEIVSKSSNFTAKTIENLVTSSVSDTPKSSFVDLPKETLTTKDSIFGTSNLSVFENSPKGSIFALSTSVEGAPKGISIFSTPSSTSQNLLKSSVPVTSASVTVESTLKTPLFGTSSSVNSGNFKFEFPSSVSITPISSATENASEGQTATRWFLPSPEKTESSLSWAFGSTTIGSTKSEPLTTSSTLTTTISSTKLGSSDSSLIITPIQKTTTSESLTSFVSTSVVSSSNVQVVTSTPTNLLPKTSVFANPSISLGSSNVISPSIQTSLKIPTPASSSALPVPLNLSKGTPTSSNLSFTASPSTAGVTFGGSLFGQTNSNNLPFTNSQPTSTLQPTTVNPSLFSTSTTNVSPLFGGVPQTTAASLFGNSSQTTTSPFGTSSFGIVTTTSSGLTFESQPVFQSSSSLFSTTPSSTTANIFGGSFSFGSKPLFDTTTSTAPNFTTSANPSTNSLFSGGQTTFGFAPATTNSESSSFGFGGLNVQTTSASSNSQFSEFNQPSANVNPFAKTAQEKASSFGGGNLFAKSTPTTSTSSIFGGGAATNTSFGGGAALNINFGGGGAVTGNGNSLFGSPSTFGSTSSAFGQQQSTFGQTSSFGNGTFGSSNQGGAFSTGSQSVSQTGFGGFGQSPKTSGFGSAPVFGGSPGAFGAHATFGGSPAFGSGSSFGNPPSAFGGETTPGSAGAFGTSGAQPGNSTFANLANQNTLGFGSLAQQSSTNPSTNSFSGGSSFSTWR